MSDQPSALSTVPPAPPAEADYAALYGAIMQSGRGRWFLEEYARRNRNADTGQVLAAIERIEGVIQGEQAQHANQGLRVELLEMARAIAQTRADVAEFGHHDARAPAQSFPDVPDERGNGARAARDVFAAAERLQGVASTMRERGLDPATCSQIEALAGTILLASSLRNPNDRRAQKLGDVLRYLERRIETMLDACAESSGAFVDEAPSETAGGNGAPRADGERAEPAPPAIETGPSIRAADMPEHVPPQTIAEALDPTSLPDAVAGAASVSEVSAGTAAEDHAAFGLELEPLLAAPSAAFTRASRDAVPPLQASPILPLPEVERTALAARQPPAQAKDMARVEHEAAKAAGVRSVSAALPAVDFLAAAEPIVREPRAPSAVGRSEQASPSRALLAAVESGALTPERQLEPAPPYQMTEPAVERAYPPDVFEDRWAEAPPRLQPAEEPIATAEPAAISEPMAPAAVEAEPATQDLTWIWVPEPAPEPATVQDPAPAAVAAQPEIKPADLLLEPTAPMDTDAPSQSRPPHSQPSAEIENELFAAPSGFGDAGVESCAPPALPVATPAEPTRTEAPSAAPSRAAAASMPQAPGIDPLAALKALSDEERIALFT